MYYSNWKFNWYLVKCSLNGQCPLFRLSVNRGFTVSIRNWNGKGKKSC